MRPIALDLFCCGGGASRGYDMAGYEVYGIDNDPKRLRDYPYPYLVMDAIEALVRLQNGEGLTFSNGVPLYLKDIALIHASPPCQGYSIMNNLPWIRSRTYPLLILPVRELLDEIGLPYVIENVAGAASRKNLEKLGLLEQRLRAFWLCGGMFGLPIYRHRYFETNFFWPMPGHPKHMRATVERPHEGGPMDHGRGGVIQPGRLLGRRADVAGGIVVPTYDRAADVEKRQSSMLASPVIDRRRPALHLPTVQRTKSSLRAGYLETTANPIGHSGGNGAQKSGVAVGHAAGWGVAAAAMGIDWMRRSELTQAIPPVMTEYIGRWSPAILGVAHAT